MRGSGQLAQELLRLEAYLAYYPASTSCTQNVKQHHLRLRPPASLCTTLVETCLSVQHLDDLDIYADAGLMLSEEDA